MSSSQLEELTMFYTRYMYVQSELQTMIVLIFMCKNKLKSIRPIKSHIGELVSRQVSSLLRDMSSINFCYEI